MYHKVDNQFESRNFKIISVESRKGGVGKTTAALNLADLLLEKGYRVLLLDLDITGTSISGSFNNSYWRKRINSIKDYQNVDLNLLNFLKNYFLTGEPWPGFSDTYRIDGSRINIISSDIYADDGELICDPRIIFDELHSFWIIEMIERICQSFIKECSNNNDSSNAEVAVILDNSPGYVGLGKAVHEWLADIGPEKGKFITVSSLDVQDINSCMNSIITIDSLIDYRIEAAKRYYLLKQGNSNNLDIPDITEISKAFFNNLVTNNISDKYSYYRNWSASSSKPDKTYYQSFIINKVPPEIRSSTFKYNTAKVFNSKNSENLFYEFTGLQNRLEPKNCVYYDNLIHFQFVEPYIEKAKAKTNQLSSLKGYFTRINTIIKRNSDIHNGSDILNHIYEYEKLLTNLLIKLNNANFENIVRLVEDRWHPMAPLNTLLQVIDQFDEREPEESMLFPDFINKVSSLLKQIRPENRYFDYKNKSAVRIFVPDNIEQATQAIKEFLSSEYYFQDVVENFVCIMTTLQHLVMAASDQPFRQISKSLSGKHIVTLLDYNINSLIDPQKLADLYNIFIKAQCRVVNVNDDFSFLIEVLKRVTIEAKDSDSEIFPNIRDILDDVIVNRNVFHKESLIRLSKAFNRAKYMSDFRKVLEENVISQWHL